MKILHHEDASLAYLVKALETNGLMDGQTNRRMDGQSLLKMSMTYLFIYSQNQKNVNKTDRSKTQMHP